MRILQYKYLLCFLLTISISEFSLQTFDQREVNFTPSEIPLTKKSINFKRLYVGKVKSSLITSTRDKFQTFAYVNEAKAHEIKHLTNIGEGKTIPLKPVFKNIGTPLVKQFDRFDVIEDANFAIANVDIESNLYQNNVTLTYEDQDGSRWIAYLNGEVSKLQSNQISTYTSDSNFPVDQITSMIEYNHQLFLGTYGGGLYIIRGNRIAKLNKEVGFPSDHILSFCIDNQNNLWISTYNAGLIRINNDDIYHYESIYDDFSKIITKIVYDSINQVIWGADSQNNLFSINSNKDVSVINYIDKYSDYNILDLDFGSRLNVLLEGNTILEVDPKISKYKHLNVPYDLTILKSSRNGNIWLGSTSGEMIICYNNFYVRLDQNEGSPKRRILNFSFDRYDNVWISTLGEGIYLTYPTNFRSIFNESDEIIAPAGDLFTSKDKGILYFEYSGGGIGLMQSDYSIAKYYHEELRDITGIATDEEGIWISTSKGVYEFYNDSLFVHKHTLESQEGFNSDLGITAHKNAIAVNNYNYGVLLKSEKDNWYRYDSLDKLSLTITYSSYFDSQNRMWIASPQGGFAYIRNDTCTIISDQIQQINDITEEINGTIYFATNKGLYSYSKLNKLEKITWKSDVISSNLNSITYDPDLHALWIGSSKNLIFLGLADSSLKFFSKSNGINGSFFTRGSAGYLNKHVFWSTNKGMVEFIPFQFKITNQKPLIHFQSILLDYKTPNYDSLKNVGIVSYDEISDGLPVGLRTGEDVQNFTFKLHSNQWLKDDGLNFYYKVDYNEWKGPIEIPEITLSNLSAGKHVLYVKAKNLHQAESDIIAFSFEITVPFYKQQWFIVGLISFLIIASITLFILRNRFSLRKFESYSNYKTHISRLQFLAGMFIIALPLMEWAKSIFLGDIIPRWDLTFLMLIILFIFLMLTYIKNIKLSIINIYAIVGSTIFTGIFIYRCFGDQFSIIHTLQTIISMAFIIMVFNNLKHYLIYMLLIGVIFGLHAKNFNGDQQRLLIFLSGFIFIQLFALAFHLFQINKLEKVAFSEKILNTYDKLVIVYNEEGNVVYVNPYLKTFVAKKDEELLGEKWFKVRHCDDQRTQEIKESIQNQISQKISIDEINEVIHSEIINSERVINWNFQIIENTYLMAIGSDITERLEQEEEIKELSSIAQSVTNGVLVTNINGIIQWVNDSYCYMTGYDKFELLGQIPSKFFQLPDFFLEEFNQTFAKGPVYFKPINIAQYHKKGHVIWIMINMTPIFNENGDIEKIIQIVTDITEQKEKEIEFERLSLVAKHTQNPVLMANENYEITWINEAFVEQFGYQLEEIEGKNPGKLFFYEWREDPSYLNFVADIESGKLARGDFKVTGKDDSSKWMNVTVDPLFNVHNEITQFICLMQNIEEIKEAQEIIEEKNRDIVDSISYAQRIQGALLPNLNLVKQNLPEHFIYYSPKDIVSGDFYFIETIGNKVFIGIADCTGHGVPGAMMTSIGAAALNNAVVDKRISDPSKILTHVDGYFKTSLSAGKNDISDGMDIGLIALNFATEQIEYAGAKRPLVIIDDEKNVQIITGNKRSIGEFIVSDDSLFTTNYVSFQENIQFYCFSDGIPDQFGGANSKKLYLKNFVDILTKNSELPMDSQFDAVVKFISDWKGNANQTDDMVLFGGKLTKKYIDKMVKRLT